MLSSLRPRPSPAYRDAIEHLDDELARVGLVFDRQIHWNRQQGILPVAKDEFSGAFVSGDEVRALLAGGHELTDDGRGELARLDEQIAALGCTIERRLAASRADGAVLPWDTLRTELGLSEREQLALLVLTAVEITPRFRQLARYLMNDASRAHWDLGLVQVCVYHSPAARRALVEELAPTGALFRHRLVESTGGGRRGDEAPFLMRPLRVASRVVEVLHGLTRLDPELARYVSLVAPAEARRPRVGDGTVEATIEGLVREAVRVAAEGATARALLLVGPAGVGKRSLLGGAARALGRRLIFVDPSSLPESVDELERIGRALGREAVVLGAIPVLLDVDAPDGDAAGKLATLGDALDAYRGPLALTACQPGSRLPKLRRGVVRVDVTPPTENERLELWRRAFADGNIAPAVELPVAGIAARYAVNGGVIEKVAAAAATVARGRGSTCVAEHDLREGLRSVFEDRLGTLGTRIHPRQTWDDLVLRPDALDAVLEFMSRVTYRRQVYEGWGFARKMAKGLGIGALFSGPPGTGKTMVASLIAGELGLDLYQIDLSRMVSKYVGETEKNLANVFDAAETGHAILLFDEADSLFARRTDVKSSNDRYANLEVNFLLQRMEAFNGITMLTTNLQGSIDPAFRRRLAFHVDFPFPDPGERALLWQAMIPRAAAVAGAPRFDQLGKRFEMAGGNIRNAVLRAAFLAVQERSPITMEHLLRAAKIEYRAMGKVFDDDEPAPGT